jgi:signal transduction histidine kinase
LRLAAALRREKEALEQQTATAEILRVIASSPTSVQPVFDAIAENAARLCSANDAQVLRVDGEVLRLVSAVGASAIPEVRQLTRAYLVGRAVIDRQTIHVPDIAQALAEYPETTAPQYGVQSLLAVPLLRDGVALGAIRISRTEMRPFTDNQILLLQTFADQAVIAIENVRLFTELDARNRDLAEALDRQTATSEILRVVASSPTDLQPVFSAIAESAKRLLGGFAALITRLIGEDLHLGALTSTSPAGDEAARARFPRAVTTFGIHTAAARTRAPFVVADIESDQWVSHPGLQEMARARGWRSFVAVPMLQGGQMLGTIGVSRPEAGAFKPQEIALLETFADQAVIAIENVRLFTELEEKNRALTAAHEQISEAFERQTATADILGVISRSPTDVQPVFDAILTSAVGLLGAFSGTLTRIAGEQIELAAITSTSDVGDAFLRTQFPQALSSAGPHARTIRDRAPLNIAEAQTDPRLPETVHAIARVRGYRSQVFVPLLRHDEAIGAISLTRAEPGGFTIDEIGLLQSFADQAVIAIENVRLFKELQARTGELTRSVEQLTALGEVGQAVSSSLDLETVLTTIVSRAVQLSGLDGGVVFEYDEAAEKFVQRAAIGTANRATAAREEGVRKGEGVVGRTALTLQPVQIPDISVAGAYEGRIREDLIAAGVRALVAVPILREGRLIGGLAVNRNQPGEFQPEMIDLLRTFATQSALAIQNARLFREIEEKSRQLEAASQHKSEFLANMSHELRTPLNAIIGFSEVLSERMFGELNEKQEEYSKDIHASGQHLLSLINDILDLSKIEAGRMELELSDFHLPTALDSAMTLVRERAGRRGLALHVSVDERLGQMRADERKVRQVVLNLLSNAIKFTPEGGRIEVAAVAKDGLAEVSVSDTGVGIAPEDQEAVFEEFRQVGTADKKVEGTGLGLTLCRKFIELHGGKIWVKSQVGMGSTFAFTLPVRHGE